MLVAGLVAPAISITTMVVFSDTYSIAGAVFAFLDGGRYALFAIVFFFSLAFLSAKILIALWAWVLAGYDHGGMRRMMVLLAAVSKWSMLDVFIIALTVLVVEGSLFAAADIHFGIVLFTVSVLISTYAIHRLARSDASISPGD
jgi:paraquat-inducible protein A